MLATRSAGFDVVMAPMKKKKRERRKKRAMTHLLTV